MTTANSLIKAKDLMTVDPVCIAPSAGIRELAHLFDEHEISGVPVVDHQGKVIGVVSKTDLIRRCAEGTEEIAPSYMFEALADQEERDTSERALPEPLVCVEEFMTEDPLMVPPDTPAAEVARLMFEKRIHRVIVSDRDRSPLGIITSLDLLGLFAHHEHTPRHNGSVRPAPSRATPARRRSP